MMLRFIDTYLLLSVSNTDHELYELLRFHLLNLKCSSTCRRILAIFVLTLYGASVTLSAETISSGSKESKAELSLPYYPDAPCNGELGGIVFLDYNNNGVRELGEIGLEGIQVDVFECMSFVPAVSTFSDGNGDWSVNDAGLAYPLRVEFSTPSHSYLKPSKAGGDNSTSVQFVAGQNCNVHYGFIEERFTGMPDGDPSSNDILVITSCFVNGSTTIVDPNEIKEVLVAYDYDQTGSAGNQYLADKSEFGSVWGVAVNNTDRKVYTGAFMKRHVGMGPEGPGAIYQHDFTTGTNSLFVDLVDLGANVGTVPPNRGLGGVGSPSHDPDVFPLVGKMAIGGIDISDDDKTLFALSLADKTVYAVDVVTKSLTATYPSPNPGCTNGEWRPFALSYYHGELYLGGVCDASNGMKSNLMAYIYKLVNGSFVEVLSFPLDYPKGDTHSTVCNNLTGWYKWTDSFEDLSTCTGGSQRFISHPQPILSDLAFDVDGSMVIGFMDRTSHQTGYSNYSTNTNRTTIYSNFAGGDILRAGIDGSGTYSLENNSSVNGHTTSGMGNNQGPGGGEYYYGDKFRNTGANFNPHLETSLGGLAFIPGTNRTLLTAYGPVDGDQTNFRSGGVIKLDNITGNKIDLEGKQIYTLADEGTFGKSGGLGGIGIANMAPDIQVGNFVWIDMHKNGVQNSCEAQVEGMVVKLYNRYGQLIGQDSTDNKGEYYFDRSNVDITGITVNGQGQASPNTGYSGLTRGQDYYIVFKGDNYDSVTKIIQIEGTNYNLTTANVGEGNQPNANDSDVTELNVPNIGAVPAIAFTADITDHTFDAGFSPWSCELSVTVADQVVCADASVTFTATFTTNVGGTLTYQWQDNSSGTFADLIGETNSTLQITGVTAAMSGRQYRVIVTETANGTTCPMHEITCTAQADATLNVNPGPLVTVADQTVCEEEDVTFTASATAGASGTLTYQWQDNSGGTFADLTGETNSTLLITGATTAISGRQYRVIVTETANGIVCTAPADATLTVNPNPAVTVADQTVCEGEDVTFTATATAGASGALAYQWQDNSGGAFADLTGETNATLQITGVTAALNGRQYRVIVTETANGIMCAAQADATVYVNPGPTVTVADQTVCEGADVTFTTTATAGASGALAYQWQDNSGGAFADLTGATNATLQITGVTTALNGRQYRVIVTETANGIMCVAQADATLNVNRGPTVTVEDQTICEGEDVTFTATTSAGASGTLAYQWQDNSSGTFADLIGETNATLQITGATVALNGRQYRVIVTETANGITCTAQADATLTVYSDPIVVCNDDRVILECMTQAQIDEAFELWLAGFTNDCPDCLTNDLSVYEAPDSCGGKVVVKYVVKDLCGTPKDSCEAMFTVAGPSEVVVSCPTDITVSEEMPIQEIQTIFENWLNSIEVEGGCNLRVENDGTVPILPDLCVDGVTTVNWTVISDCEEVQRCTATFTVKAQIGGIDPPNCSNFSPAILSNGDIEFGASDVLTNPDRVKYPIAVSFINKWEGVVETLVLNDQCETVSWNACVYSNKEVVFSVTSIAGMCDDGIMALSGVPPLDGITKMQPNGEPNVTRGKINVYCGQIPKVTEYVPMFKDPCTDKMYPPEVQPDWIMPVSCDEESDTAEVIFRTWEVYNKQGDLFTLTDTIVVFRLPKLTPGSFVGAAEDTSYCKLDAVPNNGEALKRFASWKQPVGLHDYELPYTRLRGVTYEIPATIIVAGWLNASAQGPDVLAEYKKCVILRKADGQEVTIGDIVSGKYMSDLRASLNREQLGYGFLQLIYELNEKPLNAILEASLNFYPYLLLQPGDWVLSEGGNFELVDEGWFFNGNGNAPYWFAGGWPSIYGSGDCVSYCDVGQSNSFGCIKIQIPLLNIDTGFDPVLCDTICLPTGVHCGISIKEDVQSAWAASCPQTRGVDMWVTQTCWAETLNHCAPDLKADEVDLVVSYDSTAKRVDVHLSQWQTLIDTIGPIFDNCYSTDWNQDSIKTSIRDGVIGKDALAWERANPTTYRVGSHDCVAEVFVPEVQVIDNCSGVHSVKAMVDVKGGTRVVALDLTDTETRILGKGDTCYVYTYSHISDPIRVPFSGCNGELNEVRYEAADHCWNQSTWSKFIQITDDVAPTVITNRNLNVTLSNKIAWARATSFDEGSWDNCAIDLRLGRRTDWWTNKAMVNLCDGTQTGKVGAHAPYDNWVDLLDDLGVDRGQAITAAGGGFVGESLFNSKYKVDELKTFLNKGEVEQYYFNQIVWLWESSIGGQGTELCGEKVVHAWVFALASSIAEHCSALDEHGNSLNIKDLETLFDNLVGQYGYGKEISLLGGGWTKSVPFNCADACEEVPVELLVLDNCCNWGIGGATMHVKDESPANLVKQLPDLTISCEAYSSFYKDIVEGAASLGENGSEKDGTGVFAELDSVFGHYVKTWVDNQNRPTDIDGNLLPQSELYFNYHSISCSEKSETEKIAVTNHDGEIDWITEVTKSTIMDTTSHSSANGIIGVNCGATCTQDVWIDLDDCGQGTITRRFKISGGCGPKAPSWTVEQVIRVESACGMRESMFDLPADVGSKDAPICLPQELSEDYLPDTIGSVTLKSHLDGSLCNSIAIGKKVKVLDVLDASGMKKYMITWTMIDWCATHTSTTRQLVHKQEVIATIDPSCKVNTGNNDGDVSLIIGTFSTELNSPLKDVEVRAMPGQGSPLSVETQEGGDFRFAVGVGSQVSIVPHNNTGFSDGVSTADLIDIQRHILQKKALDSKYQRIAADVNGNGSIDGLDVLELRKLVLNPSGMFANNTSWRFFEENTGREVYEINPLTADMTVNFTGVKIGDVNLSGDPASTNRSTSQTLHMNVADKTLKGGELYHVEVRSDNFKDIRGMQYTLSYATPYITVESIERGVLNVTDENYLHLAPGVITVSWNEAEGVNVSSDEVLFTLVVKAKNAVRLKDVLSLNNRIISTEAYNGVGEEQGISLRFDGEDSGFALYQNTPNPYRGETVIGFKLPIATAATMTIYDVTGRMIKRFEGDYDAGYNEVRVTSRELNMTGVLYYQLDTDKYTATKKMIVVE